MTTTINSINEALSELQTAPGGSTFNNQRFNISGRDGWNQGVWGANTSTGYYTWGYGNGGGGGYADAIYGLNPPTSGTPPLFLSSWKGLQYCFDGSTFDITVGYDNLLSIPPFPTPPSANDVSIDVTIWDSTLNYTLNAGSSPWFSQSCPAQTGSGGQSQIPGFVPDQYVLPQYVYWSINVITDPFNFGGGTLDFQINGNSVLNTGILAGTSAYDYTNGTYGTTDASGIDLYFDIR